MPAFSLMLFLFISLLLVAMVQIHFFEIAFAKLGLTPEATLMGADRHPDWQRH